VSEWSSKTLDELRCEIGWRVNRDCDADGLIDELFSRINEALAACVSLQHAEHERSEILAENRALVEVLEAAERLSGAFSLETTELEEQTRHRFRLAATVGHLRACITAANKLRAENRAKTEAP